MLWSLGMRSAYLHFALIWTCVHCIPWRQTKANISVEYVDELGIRVTREFTENTYYGTHSSINTAAVKGQLVHAQSSHFGNDVNDLGCEPFTQKLDTNGEPWIALVRRGECDFNEKIYFTTKMTNASAIIVYDNVDADYFIMHTAGRYDVKDVVAVATPYKQGEQLVQISQSYKQVNVTITKQLYSFRKAVTDVIHLHSNGSTNITFESNESSNLNQPIIDVFLPAILLAIYTRHLDIWN